ncbi:MAG: dihydroorotate dehydrogenase (quinone) [Rickettsiales bacterium]|nr:dihydroorotate dehydrogenase (quinone) [Rickettsiales bacterium]
MSLFKRLYKFWILILLKLSPEVAHKSSVRILRVLPNFIWKNPIQIDDALAVKCGEIWFKHPICLAAGYDKNCEVYDRLGLVGFAGVEVGSVILTPQFGNPKPRFFKLGKHNGLINRYGFNSKGLDHAISQIKKLDNTSVLGFNIGKDAKSKSNEYYASFFSKINEVVNKIDYFVINISSPNTKGLRDMQNAKSILLIEETFRKILKDKPLWIKVSPDISDIQIDELSEYFLTSSINGIILTNTSIQRFNLTGKHIEEIGGISGRPLQDISSQVLQKFYLKTDGKIPLIASGGISSGIDAYERIKLGASLIQIYTAFVYNGIDLINQILNDMKMQMFKDGISNIQHAIGKNI